jgi:hypothetical protein
VTIEKDQKPLYFEKIKKIPLDPILTPEKEDMPGKTRMYDYNPTSTVKNKILF